MSGMCVIVGLWMCVKSFVTYYTRGLYVCKISLCCFRFVVIGGEIVKYVDP